MKANASYTLVPQKHQGAPVHRDTTELIAKPPYAKTIVYM